MDKSLLDGDTISRVVRNVQVNKASGALWISLPSGVLERAWAQAGLDVAMSLDYTARPKPYLVLSEELLACINESMIYPVESATAANYYMLQLLEDGSLLCRYQFIIGSRLLGRLSGCDIDGMVEAISEKIREDHVSSKPPVKTGARKVMSVLDELETLTVVGNRIELPAQQLKHYATIKVMIEKAGGAYRDSGFDFEEGIDAVEILQALQAGKKPNPKKNFQFFSTPPALVESVCRASCITEGVRVLEPSAGDGALADEARTLGAHVVCVELWDSNVRKLQSKGHDVIHGDFLKVSPDDLGLFDAIVANPPFTKNQDIDHVRHMWSFLKPGGVLSVIMSTGWVEGGQKKHAAFREFIHSENAEIEQVPPGTFAGSGTQVGAVHLVLRKPHEEDLPVIALPAAKQVELQSCLSF